MDIIPIRGGNSDTLKDTVAVIDVHIRGKILADTVRREPSSGPGDRAQSEPMML